MGSSETAGTAPAGQTRCTNKYARDKAEAGRHRKKMACSMQGSKAVVPKQVGRRR